MEPLKCPPRVLCLICRGRIRRWWNPGRVCLFFSKWRGEGGRGSNLWEPRESVSLRTMSRDQSSVNGFRVVHTVCLFVGRMKLVWCSSSDWWINNSRREEALGPQVWNTWTDVGGQCLFWGSVRFLQDDFQQETLGVGGQTPCFHTVGRFQCDVSESGTRRKRRVPNTQRANNEILTGNI